MNSDGEQHEPPKPDGQADSGEASVIQSAKVLKPIPVQWKHVTTMDNGGQCVVTIDLVDGKCSCKEEAQELVDWFELIARRFKKQAAQVE